MKGLLQSLTCSLALVLSTNAFAHFPTLNCQKTNTKPIELTCVAGFSDASVADKAELKVYSYDEQLLSTVTTASDGSVTMAMPKGEFYIVFDAAHESPAEFDYAELQ